jgi:hypothetical protein
VSRTLFTVRSPSRSAGCADPDPASSSGMTRWAVAPALAVRAHRRSAVRRPTLSYATRRALTNSSTPSTRRVGTARSDPSGLAIQTRAWVETVSGKLSSERASRNEEPRSRAGRLDNHFRPHSAVHSIFIAAGLRQSGVHHSRVPGEHAPRRRIVDPSPISRTTHLAFWRLRDSWRVRGPSTAKPRRRNALALVHRISGSRRRAPNRGPTC